MKKWEELYNQYKNGEKQERYDELKDKVDNKQATREEYDEFVKMGKIMGNLYKVDNIIEFRDNLESNLEALKKEYYNRERAEELVSNRESLTEEIEANLERQKEILAQKKELEQRISQTSDQEELETLEAEREGLDSELKDLRSSAEENNKEFARNEAMAKERESVKGLEKYSKEELRAKCFQTASIISKCELVGKNLMRGASRESITLQLEGWKDREFTSETPLPLTRREREEMAIKKQESQQDRSEEELAEEVADDLRDTEGIDDYVADEIDDLEIEEDIEDFEVDEQLPAEINEFIKEFPRLGKMFPGLGEYPIGRALMRMKRFFIKETDEIEETTENIEEIDEIENIEGVDEIENVQEIDELENTQEIDELENTENEIEEDEQETVVSKKDEMKRFKDYLAFDIAIEDVADKSYDVAEKELIKEELRKKLNKDTTEQNKGDER